MGLLTVLAASILYVQLYRSSNLEVYYLLLI